MKAVRLLIPLCAVLFCTTLAFAGPQISVSDPTCTHLSPEIQLHSNTFAFTFDPNNQTLTFCNATTDTWKSLNFTIAFTTSINLSGIYCGGPDNFTASAFDYCMVLDPSKPLAGTDPKYGQPIQSTLLHEFVVSNGDTPANFFSANPSCYFGCDPATPVDNNTLVQLSFNLQPSNLEGSPHNGNDCDNDNEDQQNEDAEDFRACGLLPNHQFTISLGCPAGVTGCDSWATGGTSSFFGLASTSPNTTTFPSVPEPSTILLVASAGVPTLLRRFRRKR
jgi:hypothetical protein